MWSHSCWLCGLLLNTCFMSISVVSLNVELSGCFTCCAGDGSIFIGMIVFPFIQTAFVFMVLPVHSMKS